MDRTILHCDLNGFYASVECLSQPKLKKVPMAVAGDPENRHGIILAKNELAKKHGVKTAETIGQAMRKCPGLVLVPPHRAEYEKYSRLVNQIYERFTDLLEPFGIDESWLDVTGVEHIFGDGRKIADTLRQTVKGELGLTISVGVSFNKIFAKLGSDYKKPDATTVITRENYEEILHPLPVSALLYVGQSTNAVLDKLYIRTIGELARSEKELIISRLGKMGGMLWDYANGLDDSPVLSKDQARDIQSIGNGMTFRRDLVGLEDIKAGVYALSDEAAWRMRKHGLKCRVVAVTIKDPYFKTTQRQKTLENPTHLAKEIAETAIELIKASWKLRAPIRMLTVTASNLVDENEAYEQTSLFDGEKAVLKEKQERIEAAMDKIRDKYGKSAVSLGGVLRNDLGFGNDPEKLTKHKES